MQNDALMQRGCLKGLHKIKQVRWRTLSSLVVYRFTALQRKNAVTAYSF